MRFARNVHFNIKAGKAAEFTQLLQAEVIPVLKKQPGFKSELALMRGSSAMGISLWDDRKSAEQYAQVSYPQVLQKLSPVIEGTPQVEMYEVAASTLEF